MKTLQTALAVLVFVPCVLLRAADPSKDLGKPNIVYILADDLGYGDVHCLNPQRGKISTPCLDKLASEGMVFTEAHSGSSVCTPTRYGVLTGRYAWRTRLQAGVLDGYVEPLIAADRLTVPGFLKQQGYQTACIGKWHLGFTIEGADKTGKSNGDGKKGKVKGDGAPLGAVTPDGPLTRGFDSYFGFHHARMIGSFFDNDRVTQIVEPVDVLPKLVEHTRTHISEQAKSGRPFFLYLALNSPHTPIVPSKEWQGKSGLGEYGDFVMETDWAVGEVLDALEKAGVTNNTLVFFTSDNGCSPAAGTPKLEANGHFASGEFRGYKADIWEGGHRVPFLVRWPGKVQPGTTSPQLICHTDLMATAADILGVKLPETAGEDSFSLLPALLGKKDATIHAAVVHHSISGRFAIRAGNWKLELCPGSGGWGKPKDTEALKAGLPPVQLYDLARDIGEQTNLYSQNPEVVSRLKHILEETIANGRSNSGPKRANDVKVDLQRTKGEQSEE